MNTPHYDLDVRPILSEGGEPFTAIMEAVAALAPGQSLRLLASFKPIPLFQVLGAKGFEPSAREIGNGDWEVIFTPANAIPPGPEQTERSSRALPAETTGPSQSWNLTTAISSPRNLWSRPWKESNP